MLNNKKGYSLTVLIIAIAVILIITTTAVVSIRNIEKDKEISKFMNDLKEVNQYAVEYFSKNSVLPVVYENGEMVSAESELIQILSDAEALYQLKETDIGEYYYVDIAKLGKIHLSDNNRGYIINEGTLNVYVKTPCEYEDKMYYTLTPYLLGEETHQNEIVPFEINVLGNPITWTNKAEILVSIPDVKVGETEGWNFKWLKGAKTADDFREAEGITNKVNYFIYGNVITLTENGVYTVYVENPEGYGMIRRVVVSKIDDIAPTIKYESGELFIDDAQTGVYKIRCKIKENANFAISQEARNAFPEYYTMSGEKFTDTDETLLEKYIWGDENIKGDTVENYLTKYEKYYSDYSTYNAILSSSETTSGEKDNASAAIELLNESHPQFAYDNRKFADTERNIVIYVEDMVGNGAVYSAVSRNDIVDMQYVSSDAISLGNSKVIINNNKNYTNDQTVDLYLQSLYAKYVFLTETRGASPVWENFDSENIEFELSAGDGNKILYAAFMDKSGKTQVVYDEIFLDETMPTNTAPIVSGDIDDVSIIVKQIDTSIVDGEETQSGISNVSYGVKKNTDAEYKWYTKIELIPDFEYDITYNIVTKAKDRAGNEQISEVTTVTFEEETDTGDEGDI